MATTGNGSGLTTRMLAVAGVAAVVDWAAKAFAVVMLEDGPVRLGSVVTLRLGRNPGVAFSLGDRLPGPLLITLTAVATVVLAVIATRGLLGPWWVAGLVLGGAAANLGDRILGGSVVDFIDLGWWPSFNLADVWLTVGCALLVLTSARQAGAPEQRRE